MDLANLLLLSERLHSPLVGLPIWTAARQLEPAGSGQLATVENKPAAPVVDPYDQGREEREEQAKAHHDAITDALQPTSSSSGLLHSFTAAGSNPSRARYSGSCSLHREVSDTDWWGTAAVVIVQDLAAA
jgi:hypothetical protein